MFSELSPFIRLSIDHSAKKADESNPAPIWNPEDNLRGNLQLVFSANDIPVLEKITVYFEGMSLPCLFSSPERKIITGHLKGVSRNWVRDESATSRIFKAERKVRYESFPI